MNGGRESPEPAAHRNENLLINEYGSFNMMKHSHVRKLHVLLLALMIEHGQIELPPCRKR
jgi:hypothetical protein